MNKTIQEIIREYLGQEAKTITQITGRGDVNEVYIVTTESSKYVVRIDSSESTIDRFKKEAWCMEETKELGILGPTVLGVGLKDEHPYMLISYIEGKGGDESTDDEKNKIWKELGKYARKIHSIPIKGYGDKMSAPGVFGDSWSRYVDYNISSLNPDDRAIKLGIITEEQSKKIKNIFLELLDTHFNFGLVHNDLSLQNTILTTNGGIYLIDWGCAEVGPIPHLDIIEILNSSLDEKSPQFTLFLDGYGLTPQDYEKMKSEIAKIDLLIHMDKLRWAFDKKPDQIEHFSQELKKRMYANNIE